MSMMKDRWMEIVFCGGRNSRFQFPVQATVESMATRIEEVLKLPSTAIPVAHLFKSKSDKRKSP